MSARILGFDGLRAIAAVGVVFCHTVAGSTQIGGYAVNLFFVLSGFLILGALNQTRERIEAGRETLGHALQQFWARRFARICPVYYVVAGLALTWLVVSGQMPATHVIAYLTYVQNYLILATGEWGPFGYTWTLAIEQQFYVLSAPILLMLASAVHRRFLGIGAIVLFGVTAVLLLLPATISPFAVYRLPLIGFTMASIGGWLALSNLSETWAERLLTTRNFLIASAFSVVLALAPAKLIGGSPLALITQLALQGVAFATILGYIVAHQRSNSVRVLNHPLLAYYGKISYSLYLVHGILSDQLKPFWFKLGTGIGPLNFAVERLSYFAFILGISTVLAHFCWRYIERAFHKPRAVAPPAVADTAQAAAV